MWCICSFRSLEDFMCYNLGADTSKDPFTPSASIMGALYECGKSTPEITQANDQIVGTGTASPWNTILPSDNAWLDASKKQQMIPFVLPVTVFLQRLSGKAWLLIIH